MSNGAIVLISGGIDSATCLAIASRQHLNCYTLSFDYGQKNRIELTAASALSVTFKAKEHRIMKLPIGELGGSALTDAALTVPDYEDTTDIPTTYVPARNTIFLSMALAFAEVVQAYTIYIGVSSTDYAHYPDCRPEFIQQFEKLANLGTKQSAQGHRFSIRTPIISMNKAEIIQLGSELGVDYRQTITCYQADDQGRACGQCEACTLRRRGFLEAGIGDPTLYAY